MGKAEYLLTYPRVFFVFSLVLLWLSAHLGAFLRRRWPLKDDQRDDFGIVQTATLTLLGLIIGFSFSMAISRYDLRKNYEEAEANAIGTEYVRADLIPTSGAVALRVELKNYLDLRILFYRTRDEIELRQISADTTRLQGEMWSAVQAPAVERPTPVIALAVSGMNDVLNSQGYTQAAWWNRIPASAWGLMIAIAICSNVLVGYGTSTAKAIGAAFRSTAGRLYRLPSHSGHRHPAERLHSRGSPKSHESIGVLAQAVNPNVERRPLCDVTSQTSFFEALTSASSHDG